MICPFCLKGSWASQHEEICLSCRTERDKDEEELTVFNFLTGQGMEESIEMGCKRPSCIPG